MRGLRNNSVAIHIGPSKNVSFALHSTLAAILWSWWTHGLEIRGLHLLTSCTETKNGAARTPFYSILGTL
jgi:hypothetical protein